MPYIGRTPLTGAYQLCDTITTSATATYNLLVGGSAVIPGSANNCIVSLNGVVQAPVGAFTVSGSQITFASALTSSDVIDFILILGNVFDIGTPTNGAVTNSSLNSNVITGQTAETSVAGGDLVLLYDDSASALRKMTRTNFVGGGNTPAFSVYASADLAVTTSVLTKVQMNTEILDTDSKFDNVTNYRFTPTIAGKYFITFTLGSDANTVTSIEQTRAAIYKNGSLITGTYSISDTRNNFVTSEVVTTSVIVDLGVSDYIEFFGMIVFSSGQSYFKGNGCMAQGYKIIQ